MSHRSAGQASEAFVLRLQNPSGLRASGLADSHQYGQHVVETDGIGDRARVFLVFERIPPFDEVPAALGEKSGNGDPLLRSLFA